MKSSLRFCCSLFFFFPPTSYIENGIQPFKNADSRDSPGETGKKRHLIRLLSMKSNILMKNGIITGQKKETAKKWKHFVAYSCKKFGKICQ